MSEWRCRFGWHAWAKWGKVGEFRMEMRPSLGYGVYAEEAIPYTEFRQERTCGVCGLAQQRRWRA